jgi:cytochrome o ubiquinol oxidase operon protein cyoD
MSNHATHPTTNHDQSYGMGKKTLTSYLLGFFLCLILTVIPFYAVMHGQWTRSLTIGIIISTAIAQLFVQLRCFLRMNTKTNDAMTNTLSFLMVIIVLFILVGGSLWIMYHLDYNMMH